METLEDLAPETSLGPRRSTLAPQGPERQHLADRHFRRDQEVEIARFIVFEFSFSFAYKFETLDLLKGP